MNAGSLCRCDTRAIPRKAQYRQTFLPARVLLQSTDELLPLCTIQLHCLGSLRRLGRQHSCVWLCPLLTASALLPYCRNSINPSNYVEFFHHPAPNVSNLRVSSVASTAQGLQFPSCMCSTRGSTSALLGHVICGNSEWYDGTCVFISEVRQGHVAETDDRASLDTMTVVAEGPPMHERRGLA